jgi:hypothetical protein
MGVFRQRLKTRLKPLAIRLGLHPPPLRLSMALAKYNVAPHIDAFFDSLVAQTAGLAGLEVLIDRFSRTRRNCGAACLTSYRLIPC